MCCMVAGENRDKELLETLHHFRFFSIFVADRNIYTEAIEKIFKSLLYFETIMR